MTPIPSQTVFFSAAETSGDQHTAAVIRLLRKDLPNIACDGLGGAAMKREGCKLLENLVDRSAMLSHAFTQVGYYWRLLGRMKQYFEQTRPDLVVVVDSPAWNFHVARAAKELDIPVLYYIVPQLWAWGRWRIKKLKACTDRRACILPFEKEWFTSKGMPVEYIGHPLFDEEKPVMGVDRYEFDQLDREYPQVALLPGSREHEIRKLWPTMLHAAGRIKKAFPTAKFVSAATSEKYGNLLRAAAEEKQVEVEVRRKRIEVVTRYADLALVASGTATLEVAAQHCPMIVLYHVPLWQWYLVGRWIVKTKHLCLVNILAGKELVPEFMPLGFRKREVAELAVELLKDAPRLGDIRDELKRLVEPIIQPGASARVVDIIKQMLPRY